MTSTYREMDFEAHVEAHLLVSGYEKRKPSDYDKTLCLLPSEVMAFLRVSQPKSLEKLEQQYGTSMESKLLERLAAEISKRGTLDVLRKGIKDRGVKLDLAYFKPASGMNPEHQQLYQTNRFSLVRQLKYSTRNENSFDLVLFLNGLPLLTAELKNSLTGQFVQEAIHQYKHDRLPKGELLLAFKRCLVHFAVGNEEAFMTTQLQGAGTRFLPFNKDSVNPLNANGHKTHYLWEDLWQPDTLLELLQNYLHTQIEKEKSYDANRGLVETETEKFIFPRFHQLDVVRYLLGAVRRDGVGQSYLVQHSAGSGKSNSIAWLAHQLASFYQNSSDTERLFDSIVVVTDRRILDKQLQDTIKQFEQVGGVVEPIEKDSAQLRKALQDGKDIIVTTLQKFPVISEAMSGLSGKRFAVIIDEAHSSQSGEAARHLKKTLAANLEQAEEEDRTGDDLQDTILDDLRQRGRQSHISYFAFTATPKNKTLEAFGHRMPDGGFVAHHVYSMRQAIEEGFILDVLQNYTTFKRYFKLVKRIDADKEYEKKKAIQLLTSHVDLTEHAIDSKVNIMLEHFMEKTADEIQGRARAMVVTRSRLHAVRFYLAFRKAMAERKLGYKALVAFSGEVRDPDTGLSYTEANMNGLPPRASIADAFKMPDYRILIVANKFQTGFDEPNLHTMYVDKRLAGVQAVQTLSRLNRTRLGKSGTLVLDFVNEADEILDAFQPYYQTTLLEEETDPNLLYAVQQELEAFEVFAQQDVDDFAEIFFDTSQQQERLQPVLDRAVVQWNYKQTTEREDFRNRLQKYVRLYGFLSQIVTFEDVELEKLYVFSRALNRKLPRRENPLPYEIRDAVDLDSFRIQQTYAGSLGLEQSDGIINGFSGESGALLPEEKDLLSRIVTTLNEAHGLNLSEEDRIDMQLIHSRLSADEELQAVLSANNTKAAKIFKFNQVLDKLLLEFVHTKLDLYQKLTEPQVNQQLKKQWFDAYNRLG